MKYEPAEDPVVAEVREIAMRISAKFDHDPKKYMAHLMARQAERRERLVDLSKKPDDKEKQAG